MVKRIVAGVLLIHLRYGVVLAAMALLPAPSLAVEQILPTRVSDRDQEGKLIKKVEPVYPESARSVPLRGPVILEVVVNEKGEVAEAKIVKGGNPLVQQPVRDAVKQWRYSPTHVNGRAVPVKFRVAVYVTIKK